MHTVDQIFQLILIAFSLGLKGVFQLLSDFWVLFCGNLINVIFEVILLIDHLKSFFFFDFLLRV